MQKNPLELGSNAYLFFSSDSQSKTILILAHGGREHGKTFTVPDGCEIYYHSGPDQAYKMPNGPLADYSQFTFAQDPVFSKSANTSALDMKLGKVLGSHWDHWDEGTTERGYKGLIDKMKERHDGQTSRPHVVVIRNRSKALLYTTPYVWLSEIVARILRCSQLRGPFDIHIHACLTNDDEIRGLRAGKQRFQDEPELRD
jgi:hypothetical protein